MLFPLCTRVYAGNAPARDTSTRKERNFIRQGNKHYNDKHFADAEILYRKALEENELSEAGQYNLALSLIRQAGNADPNNGNNPMAEAQALLNDLARTANNVKTCVWHSSSVSSNRTSRIINKTSRIRIRTSNNSKTSNNSLINRILRIKTKIKTSSRSSRRIKNNSSHNSSKVVSVMPMRQRFLKQWRTKKMPRVVKFRKWKRRRGRLQGVIQVLSGSVRQHLADLL